MFVMTCWVFQVDATPQTEADLAAELDKVAKQYGGGKGVDMTKFPEFKWAEPQLDDIDLKAAEKWKAFSSDLKD